MNLLSEIEDRAIELLNTPTNEIHLLQEQVRFLALAAIDMAGLIREMDQDADFFYDVDQTRRFHLEIDPRSKPE